MNGGRDKNSCQKQSFFPFADGGKIFANHDLLGKIDKFAKRSESPSLAKVTSESRETTGMSDQSSDENTYRVSKSIAIVSLLAAMVALGAWEWLRHTQFEALRRERDALALESRRAPVMALLAIRSPEMEPSQRRLRLPYLDFHAEEKRRLVEAAFGDELKRRVVAAADAITRDELVRARTVIAQARRLAGDTTEMFNTEMEDSPIWERADVSPTTNLESIVQKSLDAIESGRFGFAIELCDEALLECGKNGPPKDLSLDEVRFYRSQLRLLRASVQLSANVHSGRPRDEAIAEIDALVKEYDLGLEQEDYSPEALAVARKGLRLDDERWKARLDDLLTLRYAKIVAASDAFAQRESATQVAVALGEAMALRNEGSASRIMFAKVLQRLAKAEQTRREPNAVSSYHAVELFRGVDDDIRAVVGDRHVLRGFSLGALAGAQRTASTQLEKDGGPENIAKSAQLFENGIESMRKLRDIVRPTPMTGHPMFLSSMIETATRLSEKERHREAVPWLGEAWEYARQCGAPNADELRGKLRSLLEKLPAKERERYSAYVESEDSDPKRWYDSAPTKN